MQLRRLSQAIRQAHPVRQCQRREIAIDFGRIGRVIHQHHDWTSRPRAIALLAVKFLLLQASFPWSLSRLIALLRQQLFVYRDPWRWLESPLEPPMELTETDSPQLPLALEAS